MPTLNWLTREEDLTAATRVPYRLLEEVPELSYTEKDERTENMLIQGDNLEALKALLPFYAGKVKCIFIDPPYNTRSAFEHYDDNLEHSQWLAMMYPRLQLLRDLMAEDASIWVTVDDNEAHYLKVTMDEVWGRKNFVGNVIWQKKYAPQNDAKWLSDDHDHLLVYAKNKAIWRPNKLPRTAQQNKLYKNPDHDPRGSWMSDNYTCAKNADERPNLYYSVTNPNTLKTNFPKRTRVWGFDQEAHRRHLAENLLYWGKKGTSPTPRLKKFLNTLRSEGTVSSTIWGYEEVGHNQDARREVLMLNPENPFATPKPEALMLRVMQLATRKGDWVLDSFLGSGTTAAVAHKMERHHVGIEMGEHASTHCVPRLKHVVDGEQGGISEAVGWKGGGGFRFYKLGKTIFDDDGQIDPAIRFPQLAAHLWVLETRTPLGKVKRTPKLGVHEGTAYYLLYNGVLGDKRPDGGNVLTRKVLGELVPHDGPRVIYGESCRLGAGTLKTLGIVFKQTPYDVRGR